MCCGRPINLRRRERNVAKLIEYLQSGITLTTPIFFFIVLVTILRTLRNQDLQIKTLLHIKRHMDKIEKTLMSTSRLRTDIQLAKMKVKDDLEEADVEEI